MTTPDKSVKFGGIHGEAVQEMVDSNPHRFGTALTLTIDTDTYLLLKNHFAHSDGTERLVRTLLGNGMWLEWKREE